MTLKEQLAKGERDAEAVKALQASELSLIIEIANLKAENARLREIVREQIDPLAIEAIHASQS